VVDPITLAPDERARFEARFWSYVDRSGGPDACWPWLSALDQDGYGRFSWGPAKARSHYRAHRLAWLLTRGPLPQGHGALHSCDAGYPVGDVTYRRCCNDAHLWTGTDAENFDDMLAKSRNAHGARVNTAKLTDDLVRSVRARCAAGERRRALARELGVCDATIDHIMQGLIWKHVV
jgi:hypothetical protein